MEKSIYNLNLNENIYINDGLVEVIRVPGGWIYNFSNETQRSAGSEIKYHFTSVFVPFNNEYQK